MFETWNHPTCYRTALLQALQPSNNWCLQCRSLILLIGAHPPRAQCHVPPCFPCTHLVRNRWWQPNARYAVGCVLVSHRPFPNSSISGLQSWRRHYRSTWTSSALSAYASSTTRLDNGSAAPGYHEEFTPAWWTRPRQAATAGHYTPVVVNMSENIYLLRWAPTPGIPWGSHTVGIAYRSKVKRSLLASRFVFWDSMRNWRHANI